VRSISFEQRTSWRDVRGTKAVVKTLPVALAVKGLNVTVGQSLEMIAELKNPWRSPHHTCELTAACGPLTFSSN
jgi:hypothetical protein